VPALAPVFGKVWDVCSRGGHAGRAVTVKVEYAAFQQITRSRSGAHPVAVQTVLDQVSLDLLRPLFPSQLGLRLLGVTLSGVVQNGRFMGYTESGQSRANQGIPRFACNTMAR